MLLSKHNYLRNDSSQRTSSTRKGQLKVITYISHGACLIPMRVFVQDFLQLPPKRITVPSFH